MCGQICILKTSKHGASSSYFRPHICTCYYTNQIKHKLDNKIRIFDQVTIEINIEKFQQKLEETNINLILQETDSNTAFCMFINKYTSIFNQ